MIKPAMPYLDIIADAQRVAADHVVACYQVSGEYAMIVAGARAGVYDLKPLAFESINGMIRAGMFRIRMGRALWIVTAGWWHFLGATIILSYFTPQFLDWLDE
jgi:porphobilinogen synthase